MRTGHMIDLRSDTVTRPTAEMYQRMISAPVGDDVYRDDPTVAALEERAAELTGKEAALLCVSGTMGNLLALMVHVKPTQSVLCAYDAHIYNKEGGGMAALCGAMARPLENKNGRIDIDLLRSRIIQDTDLHHSQSALICLENTFGGVPLPLEYMRDVQALAREYGLPVHLDGARLFNAALALGVSARDICDTVDTVQFCLSKGLGAPIGSLLCAESGFIERARFARKRIGGGMRQAGVLAAAGLVALDSGVKRLEEDHKNAARLAQGLTAIPGVKLLSAATNMVFIELPQGRTVQSLIAPLKARGVLIYPGSGQRLRLVTHLDVGTDDIERAIEAFAKELS